MTDVIYSNSRTVETSVKKEAHSIQLEYFRY